jgi:hypothetical protein
VYFYNVEEHGEQGKSRHHANGDGNGSIESVNDDAKHDAKPEAIAESEP